MSKTENSNLKDRSRLLENESIRLQREVDDFTHKLEQQRRRNASIEEQVHSMSSEVRNKQDELKSKLPSFKEERRLDQRIKTFENNLQKEVVKLNDIQTKNKALREKINVLRREKKAYKENFERIEQELKEKSLEAEKSHQNYLNYVKAEEKYKLKMLKLKNKAEQDINQIQSQFTAMQSAIEEDKKKQYSTAKEMNSIFKGTEIPGAREDHVDPHSVIQALYNKWVSACRERKRVVDQYHKNIKVLSDAFNQIREATGIDNIEEMVTSFIKSEEQHYTLYSYVNTLNTELDSLEERYQYLCDHYEKLKNIMEQEKNESLIAASQLSSQVEELNAEEQKLTEEISGLKKEISEVQDPVEEMIKEFEECLFTLDFNKKLTRDEGFTVNEQNIEQYLGELEDYLSSLVTHLATEKGMSVFDVSLENISQKETKKVPENLKEFLEEENLIDESEVEDTPLKFQEFQEKTKQLLFKKQQ